MTDFCVLTELQNFILESAQTCEHFMWWQVDSIPTENKTYAQEIMQHESEVAFSMSKAYLEIVGPVDSEPR